MEKKTIRALGITAAALGGLGMTALAVGIGEVIWLLHKSARNQKQLLKMLERKDLTEEVRRLQDRMKLLERKIEDRLDPFQDDIQRIIDDPDPVGRFMKMVAALDEEYLPDEDSVRIVHPQDTETNVVYASPEFWNGEYPFFHGESDEPSMGEVYASPDRNLFD